ncbi:unnamed protein product [marine sediment metagenome]|uniref:Uncharacterized protein n=1 Tax=marine sediment metagenome TaxID=412755 RepID=X0YZB2_9ZZZZ
MENIKTKNQAVKAFKEEALPLIDAVVLAPDQATIDRAWAAFVKICWTKGKFIPAHFLKGSVSPKMQFERVTGWNPPSLDELGIAPEPSVSEHWFQRYQTAVGEPFHSKGDPDGYPSLIGPGVIQWAWDFMPDHYLIVRCYGKAEVEPEWEVQIRKGADILERHDIIGDDWPAPYFPFDMDFEFTQYCEKLVEKFL